ncbi:HEAT repeat domain-containing protein [Fortiea contorta]|uniref:HEAT repeat domain-containing protein n=1 Tax=Fortiea contorta TaxID=1892405 RepID=UPI000348291A
MDNINQLLVQAQIACDAADWSLLIQYLQELILHQKGTRADIAQNREQILDLALSVLEMGDFQQRWEVAKVFTNLGEVAIPSLIDIIENEDAEEEVRWYAVRILGEFQHPEAIAPLISLLRNVDSEELQAIASTALGQIGAPAIASLTELLAANDTKLLAVRSLAYIRHPDIIPPLLALVQDSQASVRTAAIEAISNFPDKQVSFILVNALDDSASTVRRVAVLGLGFCSKTHQDLDLVQKIQPKLYDLNQDVACAAAVSLARIGGADAAEHLFQVLTSPQAPLRLQLEAIRALSRLETAATLKYLQQVLNIYTTEVICQEIVTVFGRVQQPQLTKLAGEILLNMLKSKHPATNFANIKSAIALSLGQLGAMEAIEPLISLLADADASVRLHAIASLKNLAPEATHQQLQQLADTTLTPDLQQGIAIALAEWGR